MMVGVDANVLVRYVTNDDQMQARTAMDILEKEENIFVPKTVLLEMEWVLRAVYNLKPPAVSNSMRHILGLPNVTAEDMKQVATALEHYAKGMDFGDALHLASCHETKKFYTFDKEFAKCARNTGVALVELAR